MNISEKNDFLDYIKQSANELGFSVYDNVEGYEWYNGKNRYKVFLLLDYVKNINSLKENSIIIPLNEKFVPIELYKNYFILTKSEIENLKILKTKLTNRNFELLFKTLYYSKNLSLLVDEEKNISVSRKRKENSCKTDDKLKNISLADFETSIDEFINDRYGEFAKKDKNYYIEKSDTIVIPLISKKYKNINFSYWYAFYSKEKKLIESHTKAYILLVIPDKNGVIELGKDLILSLLDYFIVDNFKCEPYYVLYLMDRSQKEVNIYLSLKQKILKDVSTRFYLLNEKPYEKVISKTVNEKELIQENIEINAEELKKETSVQVPSITLRIGKNFKKVRL